MASKASSMVYFFVLIGSTLLFSNNVYATDYDNYINVYELTNGKISIKVTNYGATLLSVIVPDRNGLFTIAFLFFIFSFRVIHGENLLI